MSENTDNQLKYDAFISYRHCELDQFVAINLHKKLESFKAPKSVQKLVKSGKTRIERVFRDEDELPLSDNLSEPIDQALSNSEFLIVICTPRLSQSKWCLREIETFIKKHDRKHVLLVLAEGEPEESFPEILTYEEVQEKDKDGNVKVVRKKMEPLAADVRGLDKKEMLKAMDIAVIKLAAAIFGLNYDDLRRRHHEQKIKKLTTVWGTISVVILMFAIVSFLLLTKINAQKKEITDKYASAMASASEELLQSGRRKDALSVARSVLPTHGKYNADSYRALTEAVAPYTVGDRLIPESVLEIKAPISDFTISGSGTYAAILGSNNECSIIDIASGKTVHSFSMNCISDALPEYGFDGDEGLIYADEDSIKYLHLYDYSEDTLFNQSGYVIADETCDVTIVLTETIIAGYRDGQCIYTTDLTALGIDCADAYNYSYGFSPDKKYIAISSTLMNGDTWVMLAEVESGTICNSFPIETDGSIYVATNGKNIYILENDFTFSDNSVYCVDSNTGDIIEKVQVGMLADPSIEIIGDELLISDSTSAYLKDLSTLDTTAELSYPSTILDGFEYENYSLIVSWDGNIFLLGNEYPFGMEYGDRLFEIPFESKLRQCQYLGGKFYFNPDDTNYIAIYGPNPSGDKEKRENGKTAYEEAFLEGKDAMDAVDNIDDLEKQYVYSAIYSNDNQHIAVVMVDGTLKIYDSSYSLEKTLYSFGVRYISGFIYIQEEDIFVVNSLPYAYILDKNLNYISRITNCIGYEDGNFVVEKDGEYYDVPYIPYDEMIKKADEIIGDYTMSESVSERYGISH